MSQPVPPPLPADGHPYQAAPEQEPAADRFGLGVAAAFAAALVAAGAYGAIAGAMEREIGWAAVGVGFVTGLAAGKAGGRNPILPVVSGVLALGAVYLGQLLAISILFAEQTGVPFTDFLLTDLGTVTAVWNESVDLMTFLFFALSAFAAFSGAKKASD